MRFIGHVAKKEMFLVKMSKKKREELSLVIATTEFNSGTWE